MKLLIAGDISLRDRTAKCNWSAEELSQIFSNVSSFIKDADHAIVNLESPVTERIDSIIKDGPVLKNEEKVLAIIKYCGFDTVSLANNHLKDYDCQGVVDTIAKCKQAGLQILGAGLNIKKAKRPIVYEDGNLKVGVLNVCEHESSIATENKAGAAPLDLTSLFYDIRELKEKADKIVVIIHGGCEHYQLPTPRMKKEYRLLIDYGVDVIVNHHQHCYSGYEIYNKKPIFYGLGNFYFDNPKKRNDKWNEGLLLELELTKNVTDYKLIPYHQCDSEPTIELCKYEDFKNNIEQLNTIIADDDKLNDCFDKLVDSKKPLYPFLPYGNHYLRALYGRGYLSDFMTRLRKVKIFNAISCETHREVLLRYFENYC